MATVTMEYGKGYRGKASNRCWVARILGTDRQYGLRREFIEPTKVEREHFNRPRTKIHFTYDLGPGLYELSQYGDRFFRLCWSGGAKWKKVEEDRVKAIVALMDDGAEFEDARKATIPDQTKSA